MKKVYIIPAIEIVASRLNQEMMEGHSFDYADSKGINFEDDETEEEIDWSTRNIWEE